MKKNIFIITMFFLSITINAQNQMTNFGNLKFHPGAIVSFFGNLANNGTIADNGREIYFNGNSAQTISGTSAFSIRHLDVNNSNGLTMQQNIIIGDTLELSTGPLLLNSKTLTLNNSSPTGIFRTNGYIVSEQSDNSGKLIWNIGNTFGAHVFPFGKATGEYIPFTLTTTAGNIGNVTVSTFPTATNNTPLPTTPVAVTNVNTNGADNSTNTVDRFWQIDKDGVSGTATLTFTATATEIGSIVNLNAQRWNGAINSWDAPLSGQTNTATTATVPAVTSFSTWALSGNNTPLPIELLSFNAAVTNSHVDLNWKTASEKNNDYFTVEKTKDGSVYEYVATIQGAGNSSQTNSYSTEDANPYLGSSYYRLKQTDFDGKYTYSELRYVSLLVEKLVNISPNPSSNGNITVTLQNYQNEIIRLEIKSINGEIVYSQNKELGNEPQTLIMIENLSGLAKGLYFLKLTTAQTSENKKFVIE